MKGKLHFSHEPNVCPDKYSQSLLSFGTKLCMVAPVYHIHFAIMTMQQVLQSLER